MERSSTVAIRLREVDSIHFFFDQRKIDFKMFLKGKLAIMMWSLDCIYIKLVIIEQSDG